MTAAFRNARLGDVSALAELVNYAGKGMPLRLGRKCVSRGKQHGMWAGGVSLARGSSHGATR
jgi:hypothetical protein